MSTLTLTFGQNQDYWKNKLSNYLHDPPDKALAIPGHEERTKKLCDILDLPTPARDLYQRAD